MAKKTCNKGHIYDSSIYGDNCPFCPSELSDTGTVIGIIDPSEPRTEINSDMKTHVGGTLTIGSTIPIGSDGIGGGTVIRPVTGNSDLHSGKRIVGIFATYDTTPSGEIFNIYEGRNYIGRDATSDIRIQSDSQVSGKHFSVLYRTADGKFKFRDEQSSNGTYINEVLTDEGGLSSFDLIRIGSTRLIFIAIPQLV